MIAQLAGATTAAGVCRVIFPAEAVATATLGLPLPAPWASTGVILLAEFVMTYLLMTSIYGTAIDDRGRAVKIGGFGIGSTVAFDILAGGAVTGRLHEPCTIVRTGAGDDALGMALGVLGGADRRRLRGVHSCMSTCCSSQ